MARFSRELRIFIFAACAVFAVLAPNGRAAALDCGRRLILVGDAMARVRALCGEPASISTRTESRTVFGAARRVGGSFGEAHTVTIQVEVWVYDFGPRRFMEELTFADGVLRGTRSLGYGTVRAEIRRDCRGAVQAGASVAQERLGLLLRRSSSPEHHDREERFS
jgi:hypothetical protein